MKTVDQPRDEHDGMGGTFEVDPHSGKRRLVEASTQPHPDGGARDAEGELTEAPVATTEPAVPAPAAAPWAAHNAVNTEKDA